MTKDDNGSLKDTVGQFEDRLIARINAGKFTPEADQDIEAVSGQPRLHLPTVGSTVLDRWVITQPLGHGAFGAVFEARHLKVQEILRAIKFLLPEHARNPDIVQRFHDEAAIMATIKGKHLVDVTDYGEHDGVPLFMMERLEGEPLEELMSRLGPLSLERFFELARHLLTALTELHAHRIVHRDLKPANIFVTNDSCRLKLLDFGLAKTTLSITRSKGISGTPLYMSPEQFSGEGDARSDIYSASVVLYQMLTGTFPITLEGNVFAFAQRVRSVEPAPIASLRKDVPAVVSAAIEQGLAKDPDQRPQTAKDLWERLGADRPAVPRSDPPATEAPPLVSVRLVLGKPKRSTSFLALAFRPKIKIMETTRFSVDEPIAGVVSSTVAVHVVVMHTCNVTKECVRVHPDDDALGEGGAIPRIQALQGRMLIDGYATEPRGSKEFRAYASTEAALLKPLLSVPCDEPVDLVDVRPILAYMEQHVEDGRVHGIERGYEVI